MWDPSRRAWVALTPEEHVRQWLIDLLIDHYMVDASRIATEFGVKIEGRMLRVDVVVFEPRTTSPLVVVECKAPKVVIDRTTFDQAAVYNSTLRARFIIATNGLALHIYDTERCCFVDDLAAIFGSNNISSTNYNTL